MLSSLCTAWIFEELPTLELVEADSSRQHKREAGL
jgi:hypothetical protein